MDSRKIEIAKRCKLLTGSYEGKTKDCPCKMSFQCRLFASERKALYQIPIVVERRRANLEEFESLKYESTKKGIESQNT